MASLPWWPVDLFGPSLLSAIFHARYSLLTLAAPGVFACLALWVWPRGTLYSLLLPRMFRDHEASSPRALVDLFWIAFAAACLTAVAGAGVKVAATHGPERTPSLADASLSGRAIHRSTDAATCPDDAMLVWPLIPLLVALAATMILPAVSITIWHREQHEGKRSSLDLLRALAAVAAGVISAGVIVLLIGVLRRSLFGPDDWILPLRPPRAFVFEDRDRPAYVLGWLGRSLHSIGLRAGYVDHRRALWAGQAELMLCVLVAASVYACSILRIERGRRPEVRFCTAVYLLTILGTAGVVLAGVAFWADGLGLPALLMVAAEVAFVAWLARTDHFFELRPRHDAGFLHTIQSTAKGIANHLPSLEECFRSRLAQIPPDADGRRTAIIVTASGGGIQASAWTAEVMTGLAETFPGFADSLCLVSGVSGGSVGAGCFLAGTYIDAEQNHRAAVPGPRATPAKTRFDDIRERGRHSLLEQVAWGVAFTDLPRLFTGFIPRNRLVDRGWAIEQLIEKRLAFGNTKVIVPGPSARRTVRDLCPAVAAGVMPVPLFNATCVQTGQRVIISPVRFGSHVQSGSRSLHMPADYSEGEFQADPTLATAIRMSATFSYASPVARPTLEEENAWRSSMLEAGDAVKAARFNLHLCDGGYADNTGVVAAVEACRDLLAAIDAEQTSPRTRILFIRIEPFPPDEDPANGVYDGFSQAILGPAYGLLSARVATQRERADRDLAQFIAEARDGHIDVAQAIFRFGVTASGSPPTEKPPLSWSLSDRQQEAVKHAWTAICNERHPADTLYTFAEGRVFRSARTA